MTGLKIFALTPLLASLTLPDGAEKYSMVALLVSAVVALWYDSTKKAAKLEKLLAKRSEADVLMAQSNTLVAENLRSNAAILVELKTVIIMCQGKGKAEQNQNLGANRVASHSHDCSDDIPRKQIGA